MTNKNLSTGFFYIEVLVTCLIVVIAVTGHIKIQAELRRSITNMEDRIAATLLAENYVTRIKSGLITDVTRVIEANEQSAQEFHVEWYFDEVFVNLAYSQTPTRIGRRILLRVAWHSEGVGEQFVDIASYIND